MRGIKPFLVVASLLTLALPGYGATKTQARLILAADVVKPGETFLAGVLLKMPARWHTYWRYGGDSGGPTKIAWQLPAGIQAGEILWPVPEKLVTEGLTTYVYHDEVLLMVPLTVSKDAEPGRREVKASVSWLECAEVCLLGKGEVQATLEVGATSRPSADSRLFEEWRGRLPKSDPALVVSGSWENPPADDRRPLTIETSLAGAADFFPYAADHFEVLGDTAVLSSTNGITRLEKQVRKSEGDWPGEIMGLLIAKSGGSTMAYEVLVSIGKPGAGTGTISSGSGSSSAAARRPLLVMLVFAFVGGLILNIMPCVLPVIALKVLGFVNQAKEHPARVRHLGLVYAAGVLVSFLALAALVIGIRAAGHKAGWGMQFGDPKFTIGFTVLMTLVAVNLFGVFEVGMGGRVMGAAGDLASRHGAGGAFFNGVLATILATPCTAPFLSVALGFAFAQSGPLIVLFFLTVGAGLALPYVLLSWYPAWLKWLPRPGAWMEQFKIAMGFPMLATAVWLSSLVTDFYGERSWWLGMFLILLVAAAWVYGEFVQRGRRRKGVALAVVLALVAIAFFWALEGKLKWRSPLGESTSTGAPLKNAPAGFNWQRWSPEAVKAARAEGRVVVVDFTAKWCITCNTIVKPAFEKQSVVEKLSEVRAVALTADYSRYPPEIAEELERFDRAGVPLVVVYPRDSTAAPIILPDPNPLLGPLAPTHYASIILDALSQAAGPLTAKSTSPAGNGSIASGPEN